MALRQITLEEFEKYNTKREQIFPFAEEKKWYSEDDVNIIGTLLFDKIDLDWSYVIIAKEEDGVYRASDVEVSIESQDLADRKLVEKMHSISKNGKIEKELYNSTLFDPNSAVIITDINEEIKKYLKKYPEKLYEMDPRKFEELIASIFEDLGYNIELTKATRDGGRDIIARIKNAVTEFLVYVECKRYSPKNTIGVDIVRKVTGVHHLDRPSKSIIVTTSFFTEQAIEAARKIENQLDLKDYNDIKGWLEKY